MSNTIPTAGMRLGILVEGYMAWAGGIDFLRMLVDSLRLVGKDSPELVLLVPRTPPLLAVKSIMAPWYRWLRGRYRRRGLAQLRQALREQRSEQSPAWQLDRLKDALGPEILGQYFMGDADLDAVARRNGLACLLPSIKPLPSRLQTPWIGYIFDFQHRFLPHFFTPKQCAARDQAFRSMARAARYVIVNSKDTRRNCARFLDKEGARFVALPFGATPRTEWLTENPSLVAKYELPRRYFLVSNQFWVHKNHRVVFEALSLLRDAPDAADVDVVCTGSTIDTRDRGYFPSLLRLIQDRQLTERVKILGLLPKRDQIEIMKSAVAVIQPSLFEGGPGGGALYDAVSLGVPAVVSDIPVNRELETEGGPIQFFDPQDAQGLAALMLNWARNPVGRPDAQTLLAGGRVRRQRVGAVLRASIQCAIAAHGRSYRREG